MKTFELRNTSEQLVSRKYFGAKCLHTNFPKRKNGYRKLPPRITPLQYLLRMHLTHQSKSLIFYFGMKKFRSRVFEDFVENTQTKFHILKFRVCVNTKFELVKCALSVFDKIFKKPTQKFFYTKIWNQSFRLMGWSYLCHF